MRRILLSQGIVLRQVPAVKKHWALNVDTGDHFSLNATAYWLLECIASGVGNREVLLDKFMSEFKLSERTAADDLEEILSTFEKEGITQNGEV